MGNGLRRLPLKEQQNAQVGLRVHTRRIDGHRSLELRNRQSRLLGIEVATGLLDVRRKLLLLVLSLSR